MSPQGPFVTITVTEWNQLTDKARHLQKSMDEAIKMLAPGHAARRLLEDALRRSYGLA